MNDTQGLIVTFGIAIVGSLFMLGITVAMKANQIIALLERIANK